MQVSDFHAKEELAVQRGTTLTARSDTYFALLSGVPDGSDADAISKEISGTSYARVTYACSTGNWSAPAQSGGAGTPWAISNVNAISWGNAGSAWGGVLYVAEFDALTSGHFLRGKAISISISAGQLVQIQAGAYIIDKVIA